MPLLLTLQSLSVLLDSGVLPAALQRHWCVAAEGGTTTISEFGVSFTVRCTVKAKTAVHSYRGESLQPYFYRIMTKTGIKLQGQCGNASHHLRKK